MSAAATLLAPSACNAPDSDEDEEERTEQRDQDSEDD
jgi:hypothetical protein